MVYGFGTYGNTDNQSDNERFHIIRDKLLQCQLTSQLEHQIKQVLLIMIGAFQMNLPSTVKVYLNGNKYVQLDIEIEGAVQTGIMFQESQ